MSGPSIPASRVWEARQPTWMQKSFAGVPGTAGSNLSPCLSSSPARVTQGAAGVSRYYHGLMLHTPHATQLYPSRGHARTDRPSHTSLHRPPNRSASEPGPGKQLCGGSVSGVGLFADGELPCPASTATDGSRLALCGSPRDECGRGGAEPCLAALGGDGRAVRGSGAPPPGGAAVARLWHGSARRGTGRHGTVLPACLPAAAPGAGRGAGQGPRGAARSPARTRERSQCPARTKVIPE